jgi:hypothetical protein
MGHGLGGDVHHASFSAFVVVRKFAHRIKLTGN